MSKRTVVITGVSGGVGAATATAFRNQGWTVVGMDRNAPRPGAELDDFLKVDFSQSHQILNAIEDLGGITDLAGLVNNVGSAMDKRFGEVSIEDWQYTMDVNVRAAFLLTQRLVPQLRATRGAVVMVSSVHAVATSPGASAYATSKGALVALMRSAALELAEDGIRVNAVLPGAVDTAMLRAGILRQDDSADPEEGLRKLALRTPLKVIGRPADIAEGIVFLADGERSGFITGQTLVIDGGATARLSTE